MRTSAIVTLAVLLTSAGPRSIDAKDLAQLKVLYVGSERASDYVGFLAAHVAQVEATSRADFKPELVAAFDVVLFDWPQGEDTREMRKLTSPLGARQDWQKPTVLLGSAGLNLAVAWKLKGGSGCTCMDPLAYDLREHEIFEQPFQIDRSQMVSIPTPPDFRAEIKETEIKALPLVDDRDRDWRAGWCTYSTDFAKNPDVELFCGGVNHKTPTAAGLWRQGNLLHFGFEQSPAEMNETGQHLLLNSIAYISRFTDDRPIAVTPSIFAGPISRPRSTPARWLRNPQYDVDSVKDLVAPQVWEQISSLGDREKMAAWADENAQFLHPNSAFELEIDQDLVALGTPFDKPEFFEKALAALESEDSAAVERASRLLERYVPSGPKGGDFEQWSSWWNENSLYAFASDSGDYCWYIDPLAKERHVPSDKLRGASRADRDFYTVDHYDIARNAGEDLALTIKRAQAEKKHILVQVGGDWCGWCHLMSRYVETNDQVRKKILQNYLIMKVTYDGDQKNEAFLSQYPEIPGYPHLFVLDSDGNLLHSQGTAELEEGRGYNDKVYLEFLDKWKPAS